MYGYHGRWLDVNLTTGEQTVRRFHPDTLQDFVGGSGLGARLLFDQLPAGCHPLGRESLLMFLTGPWAGTRLPSGGRTAVVCKSPLTLGWGESDMGGRFGDWLKRTGTDGLIVRGVSAEPVVLHLDGDGRAGLRPANRLWGLDSYETHDALGARYGPGLSSVSIGPAGEKQVLLAAIVSDGADARMAGRIGAGAVMGSKKLKAVAVERGSHKTPVSDPAGLQAAVGESLPRMKELSEGSRLYGTSGGVENCHALGDFPLKNWQERSWDRVAGLSGQRMADTILVKRYHCARCPTGCGRVVQIPEGPFRTGREVAGPEYETVGSLGGALLIDDLEAVARANDLCNRYGLDSISVGQVIAFALEARERNHSLDCDLDLSWGNASAMIELVHQIGQRRGLGAVLGEGVKRACQRLAGGDESLSLQVKGLELPSHDPRAFASLALGYATSPRGACHLQGYSHGVEAWQPMPELGFPGIVDRFSVAGKAGLLARMQDLMGLFDSLKTCKFFLGAGVKIADLCAWHNRVTGAGHDQASLLETGERIFNLKVLFNRREGFTREDDRLPTRFCSEAGQHLDRMLSEYYAVRGWDPDGNPRPETLGRLRLAV